MSQLMVNGTRVKIVDDVGKDNSPLIGKRGAVVDHKWNRVRQEKNQPVVQLDDGSVVSSWGLFYTVIEENKNES
jgi:hypothetical protein